MRQRILRPCSSSSPPPAAAQPSYVRTVRAGAFEAATVSLPGFLVAGGRRDRPGGPAGRRAAALRAEGPQGAQVALAVRSGAADAGAPGRRAERRGERLAGFDLAGQRRASRRSPACRGRCSRRPAGAARKVAEATAIDLRSVAGGGPGRPWIPVAHTGVLELLAPARAEAALAPQASLPLPVRGRAAALGAPPREPAGDPAAGRSAAVRRRSRGGRAAAAEDGPAAGRRRGPFRGLVAAAGRRAADGASGAISAWTARRPWPRPPSRRSASSPRSASASSSSAATARARGAPRRSPSRPTARSGSRSTPWPPTRTATAGRTSSWSIPAGLRGKELQVSAYRGLGGGKFDPEPRRWKLNDQATDWLYGPDLDRRRRARPPGPRRRPPPALSGRPEGIAPARRPSPLVVRVSGAPKKDAKRGDEREAGDGEAPAASASTSWRCWSCRAAAGSPWRRALRGTAGRCSPWSSGGSEGDLRSPSTRAFLRPAAARSSSRRGRPPCRPPA